ncbi:MAG TPA: hypothetical protein PK767_00700 [Clostridiales bacterium]|nr:hypothetical protein [Clostridiales bacterium]HPP34745.1 hypothetical protein [Clostridiales bacterium]
MLIIAVITVTAILSAIFAAASGCRSSGTIRTKLLYTLGLCLIDTSAEVAFFMFSITVAITFGIMIFSFTRLSSLWVMTPDILITLSSLILIRCHRLKIHSLASI